MIVKSIIIAAAVVTGYLILAWYQNLWPFKIDCENYRKLIQTAEFGPGVIPERCERYLQNARY